MPGDLDAQSDAVQVSKLFQRYQRDGELAAREQLISRFLPLARNLARRYAGAGVPLDDLVQVACVGLVKAIDRFEPDRGAAFTSYAVPTVVGELRRHFRDSSWALHMPRSMQERVLEIRGTVERLSGELGRSPTPGQVASDVGRPLEEVLEAMQAGDAYTAVSLDSPLRIDQDITVADSLGEIDERFELAEHGPAITDALNALPERERSIVYLRFVKDLTQTEIAERLGISQMHVSRLIRLALERMRVLVDDISPRGDVGDRSDVAPEHSGRRRFDEAA